MTDSSTKWHRRFLLVAEEVRSWSKDPSTKVGAVIVPPSRRQCAWGYNGLPSKIKDDDRILDRDWKIKSVVHAEANALLMCPFPTEDCTIYVAGCFPCAQGCAQLIIQSGISRIAIWEDEQALERWDCSHSFALFAEAELEVIKVCR